MTLIIIIIIIIIIINKAHKKDTLNRDQPRLVGLRQRPLCTELASIRGKPRPMARGHQVQEISVCLNMDRLHYDISRGALLQQRRGRSIAPLSAAPSTNSSRVGFNVPSNTL